MCHLVSYVLGFVQGKIFHAKEKTFATWRLSVLSRSLSRLDGGLFACLLFCLQCFTHYYFYFRFLLFYHFCSCFLLSFVFYSILFYFRTILFDSLICFRTLVRTRTLVCLFYCTRIQFVFVSFVCLLACLCTLVVCAQWLVSRVRVFLWFEILFVDSI